MFIKIMEKDFQISRCVGNISNLTMDKKIIRQVQNNKTANNPKTEVFFPPECEFEISRNKFYEPMNIWN